MAEDRTMDNKSQIIANLNRIEAMYVVRLTGKDLQEATRLMNETRGLLVGITTSIPTTENENSGNRLSTEGLQSLLDAIHKESFDQNRTKLVLGTIGKTGKLSMLQVKSIIQFYSDDSEKKDLLISIHDNIVDPINIAVILQSFTFTMYRDQVLKAYQEN
jgi:hypothetical protein